MRVNIRKPGAFSLLLSTALLLNMGVVSRSAAQSGCQDLPSHEAVNTALGAVVGAGGNAGLANDMWAAVVNRDGIVCVVTFSGADRGKQWPGSRVIAAQKSNTANAFSLPDGAGGIFPGLALSTANLYAATQPGGSLFGLQHSNPVATDVAYGGNAQQYGQANDPMMGKKIGGVNVFGGGLGLYDSDGNLVGALGVSGDTSCTDHVIGWKVRDALGLDNVSAGVAAGTDNIIFDITVDPATGIGPSAGGFGHPDCGGGVAAIAGDLPPCYPIGAVKGPVAGAAPSCPP